MLPAVSFSSHRVWLITGVLLVAAVVRVRGAEAVRTLDWDQIEKT